MTEHSAEDHRGNRGELHGASVLLVGHRDTFAQLGGLALQIGSMLAKFQA